MCAFCCEICCGRQLIKASPSVPSPGQKALSKNWGLRRFSEASGGGQLLNKLCALVDVWRRFCVAVGGCVLLGAGRLVLNHRGGTTKLRVDSLLVFKKS